jgi:hypothetical protein
MFDDPNLPKSATLVEISANLRLKKLGQGLAFLTKLTLGQGKRKFSL